MMCSMCGKKRDRSIYILPAVLEDLSMFCLCDVKQMSIAKIQVVAKQEELLKASRGHKKSLDLINGTRDSS